MKNKRRRIFKAQQSDYRVGTCSDELHDKLVICDDIVAREVQRLKPVKSTSSAAGILALAMNADRFSDFPSSLSVT